MKKTFLTLSTAFLMVVTAVQANGLNSETSNSSAISIEAVGINPFCKAILQGDIDTVKKLIDLGEDVNQKSVGMTPAMFAARYNKAEILKLLIENGANLKAKSDKGQTAKKIAELSNAKDALEVIKSTT